MFVLALENRSFDHMLGVSTGTVGPDGQVSPGVGVATKLRAAGVIG